MSSNRNPIAVSGEGVGVVETMEMANVSLSSPTTVAPQDETDRQGLGGSPQEEEEVSDDDDDSFSDIDFLPDASVNWQQTSKKDFAKVLFNNIPENYNQGSPVECVYTLTTGVEPKSSDFIAIFRVGWSNPRKYHHFSYVNLPESGYTPGYSHTCSVMFTVNSLPSDSDDFYQFCYLTTNYDIRGASTPFRFRELYSKDDLVVEVVDDSTDMLLIQHKVEYLQQKLSTQTVDKDKIERERDYLLSSQNCERLELDEMGRELEIARQDVETKTHELNMLKIEFDERAATLLQNEQQSSRRSTDDTTAMAEQRETISTLEREGLVLHHQLKEQKQITDMYKTSFTKSEGDAQTMNVTVKRLQTQLGGAAQRYINVQTELELTCSELSKIKRDSDILLQDQQSEKATITGLREQLSNNENQLEAVKQSRDLVQHEMLTYITVQEKLSEDLTVAQSELLIANERLCDTESTYQQQQQQLSEDNNDFKTTIERMGKKKERLQHELDLARQEIEIGKQEIAKGKSEGPSAGAFHALQKAQNDLIQKYKETTYKWKDLLRKYRSLKKQSVTLEQQLYTVEHDKCSLTGEIAELRQRIHIATIQYKEKFIETRKLRQTLKKHYAGSDADFSSVLSDIERFSVERASKAISATLDGLVCDSSVYLPHTLEGATTTAVVSTLPGVESHQNAPTTLFNDSLQNAPTMKVNEGARHSVGTASVVDVDLIEKVNDWSFNDDVTDDSSSIGDVTGLLCMTSSDITMETTNLLMNTTLKQLTGKLNKQKKYKRILCEEVDRKNNEILKLKEEMSSIITERDKDLKLNQNILVDLTNENTNLRKQLDTLNTPTVRQRDDEQMKTLKEIASNDSTGSPRDHPVIRILPLPLPTPPQPPLTEGEGTLYPNPYKQEEVHAPIQHYPNPYLKQKTSMEPTLSSTPRDKQPGGGKVTTETVSVVKETAPPRCEESSVKDSLRGPDKEMVSKSSGRSRLPLHTFGCVCWQCTGAKFMQAAINVTSDMFHATGPICPICQLEFSPETLSCVYDDHIAAHGYEMISSD